jgi:hypothetical protein
MAKPLPRGDTALVVGVDIFPKGYSKLAAYLLMEEGWPFVRV